VHGLRRGVPRAQTFAWETFGPAGRRASEAQIETWSSFNNKPLSLDRTFGFQRSAQPSLCVAISHAIMNAGEQGQLAVRLSDPLDAKQSEQYN